MERFRSLGPAWLHPEPQTLNPEPAPYAARVRCGVAGVGSLGQHHARIYASLPAAELAGIYEPDDARAAEICAQHNCRRFATLEELGAACDAVSVVVPTDRHAAVALPLLAQGCHLLIEKPLCASLEEAGQVLAAAQKHQPPRAGRPRGAFQSGDEFPGEGGDASAVHHHGAARALPDAGHGGRRGARPDDSRHRHRAGAGEGADPPHRQRGHQRAVEDRGHRQRPHRIRERLRGQPEREPHEPEKKPGDPRVPGQRLSLARFHEPEGPPGEEERPHRLRAEAEDRPGEARRRQLHPGARDPDREGRAAGDRAAATSWTAWRRPGSRRWARRWAKARSRWPSRSPSRSGLRIKPNEHRGAEKPERKPCRSFSVSSVSPWFKS